MKFLRVCMVLASALLIVPLSGCIGDEEKPPQTNIDGENIGEGLPPERFGFEPLPIAPTGTVKKEKRVVPTGPEVLPAELRGSRTDWRFTWEVSGITPIKAPDGQEAEAYYTVWLGKEDQSRADGVVWERVPDSTTTAENGTMSGESTWIAYYGDYIAMLISLESNPKAGTPHIQILRYIGFGIDEEGEQTLEFQKPFTGAFADATVEVLKDGGVNLTVSAYTLPEVPGDYDLFLKNDAGSHFLGTLKYDEMTSGYSFSTKPDAALFKNYQFFISIEQKEEERKPHAGGYPLLISKFAK